MNKSIEHIMYNAEVKIKGENGFFQIDKDKLAISSYLNNIFYPKYMKTDLFSDKVKYMVENKHYNSKLSEWYTAEQQNEIYDLVKSFNHEFKSYMAAKKFLDEYAVRSKDGKTYLEDYSDRVTTISLYLSQGDMEKARRFASTIITGLYQPATPTFQDAGVINSGELVSCFLLEMDDTVESIIYNIGNAMHLSKIGGGIAIDLTRIRPRGSKLKGNENITAGVLPIMKLMEDTFAFANKMDKRNGAGAAYLNIFHYDVLEFLDTKKINADEKSRIQLLSLGLNVPNKFFDLCREGEKIALFSSYDIFREYDGKSINDLDMSEEYDKLVANPNIRRQYYDARRLLLKIATTQMESGYPYMVFLDHANDQHALKDLGRIKMSNLCTEIFQVQEVSKIKGYNNENEFGKDINCNLGSLNINNVMESKNIEETVKTAIDALTSVVELTNLTMTPGIKKANEEMHSVGLGALNLNGFLANNRMAYESEDAVEFVDLFFKTVNYWTIVRSNEIAVEKQETFKGFEKSEYAKGTYFDKYLVEDEQIKSEKVKKVFEGIAIPTKKDWEELKEKVMKDGLWHSYRMAIAPNQSTAYIANATPSIMPITSQIETRVYGNSTTYYPMPYLRPDTTLLYKSAYNMDQTNIINIVAAAQKHVDQGISTILFVDSDTTTKDLAKLYLYAYKKGLKSLYYTRAKNLKVEECESCMA